MFIVRVGFFIILQNYLRQFQFTRMNIILCLYVCQEMSSNLFATFKPLTVCSRQSGLRTSFASKPKVQSLGNNGLSEFTHSALKNFMTRDPLGRPT